jgi:hypothetical protein
MKSYVIKLLGKANGEVISKSINNRIKAFIKKKYEGGASINSLKSYILQAFERDNIKGSLTIIQNGKTFLSVGN